MRIVTILAVCGLSLASPARAYVKLPPPPLPPVQIAEHVEAAQVLSSELALVRFEDRGGYWKISLKPPYQQDAWFLPWDAELYGWQSEPQDFGPNFAASHDGKTVAFGFNVSTPSADPADAYPLLVTAIVLCDADGSHARVAALADIVDGGPRLYFTQNDHFLLGPDYLPCAPTPDGLRAWYAAMDDQPSDALPDPPNALDLRTEQLVSFAALREVPWLTMNPYSDEFYFDEMDTNNVHFGRFVNDEPELVSTWAPPEGAGIGNMSWAGLHWTDALGGTLMVWVDGKLQILYPMWESTFKPGLTMNVFYAQVRNVKFFSRDGGHSIDFGFPLDEGWMPVPSLAHFAVPVDSDGWAERVDTWLPLPDGSGVLINTPGIDGGGLYLVKLGAPST